MRHPVGLAFAIVVLALSLGSAGADTGEDEAFVCPLCGKTFEAFVAHSGTSFGQRLDFKSVGPIYSPWPIPRCTHCGFVLYDEDLAEEQKVKLRAFVASEAYAPLWKKHTNFFCLGLIQEACEELPPMVLGTVFLKATWELKDGDERYPAYAKRAIQHLAKVPAPTKPAAEGAAPAEDPPEEPPSAEDLARARVDHFVAQYLQVELLRRSGAFEEAQGVLTKIAELDREGAPAWYEAAVAFQATLVAKKDAAPHEFRELPSEDAEEEKEAPEDPEDPEDPEEPEEPEEPDDDP